MGGGYLDINVMCLYSVVQPPVGMQSPFYQSRIFNHHHHQHHRHHHHHGNSEDAQQQQLLHGGHHSSPMHEAFPPPPAAARLFTSSSAAAGALHPADIPPPPPAAPSLLVGLSAVRQSAFEHQLNALYRRGGAGGIDGGGPLSRHQTDAIVAESASNRGGAVRSPVSRRADGLKAEPAGGAYDQLLMHAAAASTQPHQPPDAACGYDGFAVISFHRRRDL